MNAESAAPAPRFDWVDAAKGIGILLMFYGHVMQRLAETGNESAFDEVRLIYSFHMPMFFVVAGFFFRPSPKFAQRVQELAWRRLLPVVFFGLLLFPFWLIRPIRLGLPIWHEIAPQLAGYLVGMPMLDWMTWFLVCLFICEVMALICLPRLKSVAGKLLFGISCVLGGAFICDHVALWGQLVGLELHASFIHEAVVALGFYTIGHALFPCACRLADSRLRATLVAIVCGVIVLDTFQLNHPHSHFAVMMAARTHGDALFFACTSLAGAAGVLALGMLLSTTNLLGAIGRNTLPLLGLNGAFFHFFNPKLVSVLPPHDDPLAIALFAFVLTAVSLLACVPVIHLLNKYVPQLIGKTRQSGPWLPSFETYLHRHDTDARLK